MERMLFIKQFVAAKPGLDMEHIDMVISQCLDRCHDKFPEYPRGHMNLMTTMEEAAELVEAISRRMRGRTDVIMTSCRKWRMSSWRSGVLRRFMAFPMRV